MSSVPTSDVVARDGKRGVMVLGATGLVGQRFLALLSSHPWLELRAVTASPRSEGKLYQDACTWRLPDQMRTDYGKFLVLCTDPKREEESTSTQWPSCKECPVVFSALDSSIAGPVELEWAKRGYAVFSNAKSHRMASQVPIALPLVNAETCFTREWITAQRRILNFPETGCLVTNANCSSTGLAHVLAALQQGWQAPPARVHVVTLQAASGAGYPGVPSLDLIDNVVPHIKGEEAKLETEPLKILGEWNSKLNRFQNVEEMRLSASCHRVPVIDGHLASISIEPPAHIKERGDELVAQIETILKSYKSSALCEGLPSAPDHVIKVFDLNTHPDRPQPRLDRQTGKGYTISVGRIRPCSLFGVKLSLLSHNTVIGAAGGSLLNAELALQLNYIARN